MPSHKQKVIIAIPTRNRPVQYLNATIHSAAQQAKEYGHDVEIVVSDDSSSRKWLLQNQRAVSRVFEKFGVPIHYYPASRIDPIRRLLRGATPAERRAYSKLVPKKGHWGKNRNKLALLAVYHGGENAAYLHLDDDSPLLGLQHEGSKVRKSAHDVIGFFLRGLKQARRRRLHGCEGWIVGVRGSTVSGGGAPLKPPNLGQLLKQEVYYHPGGGGPSRMLEYKGMQMPYSPLGRGEDEAHSQALGGLLSYGADLRDLAAVALVRALRKRDFGTLRRLGEGVDEILAHFNAPHVLHIGAAGYTPSKGVRKIARPKDTTGLRRPWRSLVRRAAYFK